jgi:hypothetical protein
MGQIKGIVHNILSIGHSNKHAVATLTTIACTKEDMEVLIAGVKAPGKAIKVLTDCGYKVTRRARKAARRTALQSRTYSTYRPNSVNGQPAAPVQHPSAPRFSSHARPRTRRLAKHRLYF